MEKASNSGMFEAAPGDAWSEIKKLSPAETTVPTKLLLLKTYCCSRLIAAADLDASREGSATCAANSIPVVTQ